MRISFSAPAKHLWNRWWIPSFRPFSSASIWVHSFSDRFSPSQFIKGWYLLVKSKGGRILNPVSFIRDSSSIQTVPRVLSVQTETSTAAVSESMVTAPVSSVQSIVPVGRGITVISSASPLMSLASLPGFLRYVSNMICAVPPSSTVKFSVRTVPWNFHTVSPLSGTAYWELIQGGQSIL